MPKKPSSVPDSEAIRAERKALKSPRSGRHGVKCPTCGRNFINGGFLRLHLKLKSCSGDDLVKRVL